MYHKTRIKIEINNNLSIMIREYFVVKCNIYLFDNEENIEYK